LEDILPKNTSFDNYEVEHDFPHIGKRIMLLNARRIPRPPAKPRIMLLAIEDITERKQAEEEIKTSEHKLQSVFASSPDPIFSTDLNGNITDCNQTTLDFIGVQSKEELVSQSTLSMLIENHRSKIVEHMKKCAEGDIIKDAEYTFIARNGRKIDSLVSASVLKDVSGKPTGFMAVVKDITKRKQDEQITNEAREYAESILETVREPLIVLDADLKVVSANRTFYQTFKTKPEETEGQLVYDIGNQQWNIPKLPRAFGGYSTQEHFFRQL